MVAKQYTERDGRQLAVEMLRELGVEWDRRDLNHIPDEWLLEAQIAQDPAVLRRYLAMVQDSGSAQLELGFLRVLTDFIGSNMSGVPIHDLWMYEGRRHA
jgi:hypothetical protein